MTSTITKDALGVLHMVPGMRVMVTENVAIGQSVVNSAEGKLVNVQYETNSQGNKVALCAYVHIPGCGIALEGLPNDVVPIVPTVTKFAYQGPRGNTFRIS